jgi:hypothetical protein
VTPPTARCTLEPLAEAHAEALFAALSDPAIYEFEGMPPPSVAALARDPDAPHAHGPPPLRPRVDDRPGRRV